MVDTEDETLQMSMSIGFNIAKKQGQAGTTSSSTTESRTSDDNEGTASTTPPGSSSIMSDSSGFLSQSHSHTSNLSGPRVVQRKANDTATASASSSERNSGSIITETSTCISGRKENACPEMQLEDLFSTIQMGQENMKLAQVSPLKASKTTGGIHQAMCSFPHAFSMINPQQNTNPFLDSSMSASVSTADAKQSNPNLMDAVGSTGTKLQRHSDATVMEHFRKELQILQSEVSELKEQLSTEKSLRAEMQVMSIWI